MDIKIEFDELSIKFDLEEINITEEEINVLTNVIIDCEGINKFTLKDKPRIRQTINDTIDMLNKDGELSDQVAGNITYSINSPETSEYTVETKVTLSKVDTVRADSVGETIQTVRDSEDTKSY